MQRCNWSWFVPCWPIFVINRRLFLLSLFAMKHGNDHNKRHNLIRDFLFNTASRHCSGALDLSRGEYCFQASGDRLFWSMECKSKSVIAYLGKHLAMEVNSNARPSVANLSA